MSVTSLLDTFRSRCWWTFFQAAVVQAGIVQLGLPGKPVVSAWVSTDDDRRFAFVEFRTMDECANALSLNGIQFQGESLRISRPSDFEDAVRAMQAQGISIPQGPGLPMIPGAAIGGVGIPVPALPVANMAAMMGAPVSSGPAATPCMKLQNMVKADDGPEDIEDIKADVREECEKHGQVIKVLIPGPNEPGSQNVYVLFGDTAAAVKAQSDMHGRLFDGLKILASFFDKAAFEAGSLS